jgi:outer membrane protein assembly factor BamB
MKNLKLINIYKDVKSFFLTQDDIYVILSSDVYSIFRIVEKKYQEIFETNNKISALYEDADSLWGITRIGTFRYMKNQTLLGINNFWFRKHINKQVYLFDNADEEDRNCFCLYDIDKQEIIWQIKYSSTIFFTTQTHLYFASFNENTIPNILACYSYTNENNLWQFDVSIIGKYIPFFDENETIGRIMEIVGVYEHQLIVLLKGGKFISLDIETGKLLWEKSTVDINNTTQHIDYGFSDPTFPFYNKKRGEIYILQGDSFILFDIANQEASYQWIPKDDPNLKEAIFIHSSGIYKNKIHFSARLEHSSVYDMVGIFDIEQKKVIWQYKFELEKYNDIIETQMNDTHFYARDGKKNLYVFERKWK